MSVLLRLLRTWAANDSGATAIEYGLMAALISLVIVAGAQTAGGVLEAAFLGFAAVASAA